MGSNKYKTNKKFVGIYDGICSKYVFDECPGDSTCLDVGCWDGTLGKLLITHKTCVVDGIDINKKALRIAALRKYRKTYQVDLNNIKISKYLTSKYDCIICADVLEHLINPANILIQLRKFLKANGIIIVSVPNIAFIQQRVNLLLGKFDYNPQGGLMDATHLRFFTKKTIINLSMSAGYDIKKIYGYNQVRPIYSFLKPLGKLLPEVFALQFLVVLIKHEK